MTNARDARSARQKAAELRAETRRREARRRAGLVVTAVVAALALLVGVGVLIQTARSESQQAAGTAPPSHLTDGSFLVGRPTAPVTVTVWFDYLCPYCRIEYQTNKKQMDAWVEEGKVKIAYRPLAWLDRSSSDEYSSRAMNAAAAVLDLAPAGFATFHDSLFAEQPTEGGPGLTDTRLVELAVKAGAPEARVRQAVTERSFRGWVRKTSDEVSQKEKDVQGTPTVKVNNQIVKNPTDADQLRAAVEKALDHS